MSEFGDYLKKKRESREISQVNLSRLLKQKGFGISNSTISYWETGSRLPRDTNRNDLIEIGNILRMTLVEKDKLLRLVNLAPVSEGNEGEILDIAEITVTYQVDMDYNEYEKDRGGWWLKILYYRPFTINVLSDRIFIDNIQVRTSDPMVPFCPFLFEKTLPDNTDLWENEDFMQMEAVTQRMVNWPEGSAKPYTNIDGEKQIVGGIGIGKKPLRPDLDEEGYINYLREPVNYEIRIQYRLA